MAQVRRHNQYRGRAEWVNIPFKELTDDEKHTVRKERTLVTMVLTTVLTIGGIGVAESGHFGHQDPDAAAKGLRERAAAHYQTLSTREKFENTFISPATFTGDYVVGQSGVRGWFSGMRDSYAYSFGQTCLRGSAYDTTPSEIRTWTGGGDISAVASLTQSGNAVAIHPAGSNAPALEFVMQNGELIPSQPTAMTLTANSCAEPSGLVVSPDSDEYSDRLHNILGFAATLHPGQN